MDLKQSDSLPHDIEEILNVFAMSLNFRRPILAIITLITVVAIVYLFYRWLKRRKKRKKEPTIEEQIKNLSTGNEVEFYSQLTALFLLFFEKRDQTRYRHSSADELSELPLVDAPDQQFFKDFLQRSFRKRFQSMSNDTDFEIMDKDRSAILKIIGVQKTSGRYAE